MPDFLTPLYESNDCHNPAGTPAGGEFCSKGGGTSADYHDAAATANDLAAQAHRRAQSTGGAVYPVGRAMDLSARAQTASGDAGGPRKDIFKAEDVAKKGKHALAAKLHAKQAEYHRARAANWRKQVTGQG